MQNLIISVKSEAVKGLPIYLNSLSERYEQSTTYRDADKFDFHQILFVLGGKGTLKCCGKTVILKKGDAFFTKMHTECGYSDDGGLVTAFLTVKGGAVNSLADFYGCGSFAFIEGADTEKYVSEIKAIRQEYEGARRESVISARCYSFFVDFFERTRSGNISLTDRITSYVEKHFTEKLTLSELSKIFGCSVSKLCHDFKARHRTTVFEYLIGLRLSYAKEIIKNTPEASTKSVALQSGFEDVSYFCKAFKKKFGKTPMQNKVF